MVDNQAEQKTQEKKEEKPKQPTTLESVLNESFQAVKASFNTSLGLGAIGGATYFFGLDGLVVSSAFPLGKAIVEYARADGKGKFTSSDFRNEAIAGSLFTPAVWYGVQAIKAIPKAYGLDSIVTNILGTSLPLASSLTFGVLNLAVLTPALVALYYPLQYVIKNKTFKGLGKDFKENYWSGFKRNLPVTIGASIAMGATYAFPFLAPYLFPALAAGAIATRIRLSPEKIDYKKLLYLPLAPIYAPFYLATGLATTTYKACKGLFEAAYTVGSTLYEKISKFFKTATAPAPAAQPAK